MSLFDDFMDFDPNAGLPLPDYSGPRVPEPVDCMRCGMCLGGCPTYQLTHDEQEGPRQRIRTLANWLIEQREVETEALEHLQNCLQCRACEAVCPSRMEYSRLFDQASSRLAATAKPGFYATLALRLIADKRLLNACLPLFWLYRVSGLRSVLKRLGVLRRLGLERVDALAPLPVLNRLQSVYPQASAKGSVALFAGCLGDHFDRATLVAAIKVLNRIGYRVIVPEQQVCCGAIHYHNGAEDAAKRLMRDNLEAFGSLPVDAVIYCATGCGSQLSEYPDILTDEEDNPKATALRAKLFEITDFVERHWPDSLTLTPTAERVNVHEPCSQRNVLKNQESIYRLLARIPGLEVNELTDNQLCCGAGGSYMLSHPITADALAAAKWQRQRESDGDYLVTTNIGCALHLAAAEDKSTAIVHPIQLIADRL